MQPMTNADGMRQLQEMAISCGRSWQSPQTGYIHFCYTIQDEEVHHTIPTLENILFVLALMRSRLADNVNEAKETLTRLLYFQNNEVEPYKGNFPVYLHEYPVCKDRLLGVHLIAPLYWIYRNFHTVLGAELKKRLEKALKDLIHHCLATHHDKPAPYQIALKIAAGAKALGLVLNMPQLAEEGDALLSELHQNPDYSAWNSPLALSDILVALQMIYPSISASPWQEFWKHLSGTWNLTTGAYAGPGWKEYQRGIEPQPTLYDYFLGYYSGIYNYRSFFDHPIQLQAMLVHPTEDRLTVPEYPLHVQGKIGENPWVVHQADKYAYSLLAKKEELNPALEKTFIPVKLIWGNSYRVHSLVTQAGNAKSIDFKTGYKEFEIFFALNPDVNVEDRDKNREVCFFVDIQDGTAIRVSGAAATTFQIGDDVSIADENMHISIRFEVEEGEGQFFGHIMKGNRPSQVLVKGANRFDAYDWQIFLRTVRRSPTCLIKATIKIA